jgi:tetratricopeptide (TPR) repeat protein
MLLTVLLCFAIVIKLTLNKGPLAVMPRPPNIPQRKLPRPVSSATKINPIASLVQQGFNFYQQNRFQDAQIVLERALKINPNHFDTLQLLGALAGITKRYGQAVEFLSKAIKIKPNYAPCHSNLGNALEKIGRLDDALASQNRAIALEPNFAQAYYNRGITLKALNRTEDALASYDQAIALHPSYAEAYSLRGIALHELGLVDQAMMSHDQAIRIQPNRAESYSQLGVTLHACQRMDEALACYDKAIALNPNYAQAHSNRGFTLQSMLRVDEALASFSQAIHSDPSIPEAHWNLSLCQLLTGDYQRGWQNYEWRKECPSVAYPRIKYQQPLWLGQASLKDKTILLQAEQGLGDTIQFCRYAPLVAALGARVILAVQTPLARLLAHNLPGVSQVLVSGDPAPAFDYHCPLLSLPLALAATVNGIPAVNQFAAPPDKIEKFKQLLGPKSKPRVGLVWSGSTVHKNDHNRSMTLEQLLPYLPPHIEYVSLQKEIRPIDQETLTKFGQIRHLGNELEDFTDTAALMDTMDVVISVDTSVAHLAGTLGKSTWILLSYSPDWRWLLVREDSPWYPSARLYRQKNVFDWNLVLEKIKSDLLAI